MGEPVYGLWGENENHRSSIKKICAIQESAGPAIVPGCWYYPVFNALWFWYYVYTLDVPVLLADIQICQNNVLLYNSAFSLYKVTFVPFFRATNNADSSIYNNDATIYYGAGTVMGANMLINQYPNTAATNNSYSIFNNQDPYTLRLFTTTCGSGKWGQSGAGGMDVKGEFRLFVWTDNEYSTIRVPVY